jgi:hypothetical protein
MVNTERMGNGHGGDVYVMLLFLTGVWEGQFVMRSGLVLTTISAPGSEVKVQSRITGCWSLVKPFRDVHGVACRQYPRRFPRGAGAYTDYHSQYFHQRQELW